MGLEGRSSRFYPYYSVSSLNMKTILDKILDKIFS